MFIIVTFGKYRVKAFTIVIYRFKYNVIVSIVLKLLCTDGTFYSLGFQIVLYVNGRYVPFHHLV